MQSPNIIELQALASVQSVSSPRETYLEAQTKIVLEERREFARRIADTKIELRKKRIENLLKQIDPLSSIESIRAAMWNRATIAQRRIACMCANLPKERADDALIKFNAVERTKIWTALDDLVDGLQGIQKCMTGGIVPQQNTLQ